MDKIRFRARLVAPYFPDIPPEIKENWVSGIKKAAPKTHQSLKRVIKNPKDFKKKIAKPVEKAIASFIDPKFVSRSGLTHDQMMNKTRDSLAGAGKDYIQKAKAGFGTGKFEEKVELKQPKYARGWCKVTGPLKGYKKGGIKGLSSLGVMALCGDPKLKNFLKDRIDTIEGIPMSIGTGKPSPFKTVLGNQIVRSGSKIIELGYNASDIHQENQRINQLVNEYRRKEIIPFSPGGASHIDFIVAEIPASPAGGPDPAKPGEMMKWLGLDIQVSGK